MSLTDIYYNLNFKDFTCTFVNKYPKRTAKLIFHADQMVGDKLVFNNDFFNIDKKVDTIYEIEIGFYTVWCNEAKLYRYDGVLVDRKCIGTITRDEYIELMNTIHKKMV